MSKKAFTLNMAVGRDALELPVKGADGRVFTFRIPQLADRQRAMLADRVQNVRGDAALLDLLADLLVQRSSDDASRADIHAMLSHPNTTPDAVSQLLAAVLTGRLPDPKLQGQLMDKLQDRMLADLITKL